MILTTAEAAERMGRNERAIRKMCEDGTISAVKMGRTWLVQADAKTARHTKEDTNAVRD